MASETVVNMPTGVTVHSDDWLTYVDTHDTSQAATGTNKKVSPAVLSAAITPSGAAVKQYYDAGASPVSNSASLVTLMTAVFTWAHPFTVGDQFRLVGSWFYENNTGGNQSIAIATLVGGTNPGSASPTMASGSTQQYKMKLDAIYTVKVVNASGTIHVVANLAISDAVPSAWAGPATPASLTLVGDVTKDTTADVTIDVQATPGASANSIFTPKVFAGLSFH